MATNIPPHNLNELIKATMLVFDNPATTDRRNHESDAGSRFSNRRDHLRLSRHQRSLPHRRGKMILRGVIRVEDMKNGDRQTLVIDEIPYNVNKSRLIEQIAELINDKTITGISDLRDESDKDGMRIVIELKRGEIPEVTINQLYKFTDLQVTFGCNMLALDKGMPRTMNIKQMIAAWIDHRIEVDPPPHTLRTG